MKGRRKLKTLKWQTKSAIETEARELTGSKRKTQGRLLDIAAQNSREMEPLGRIAG